LVKAKRHRVFVYGTLMRGERNHSVLRLCRFLGETATAAGFRLYDLGAYPAMTKSETGSGTVIGELFEVDDVTLESLDRLEEHPEVYWRTVIQLVDRRRVASYLMPSERLRGCSVIPSGDWRQRSGGATASAAPAVSRSDEGARSEGQEE
jgi:gamma-glutamylcyclotransferase (GGCT)/AIG2-like uncharacterized protein YtfP